MRAPDPLRLRLLLALAALVVGAAASGASDTGTIVGRIFKSDTGGPLPLANVVLQTIPARWWTRADEDGRFVIPEVSGGSWDMVVSALGYETVIGRVPVGTGETTGVSASLRLGGDTLVANGRHTGPRAPFIVSFPRVPELQGDGLVGSWYSAEFPRAVGFTTDGRHVGLATRSGLGLYRPRDTRLLLDGSWHVPDPGPADLAIALGPDGVLRVQTSADSLYLELEPGEGFRTWPGEHLAAAAATSHLRLAFSGDRTLLAAWGPATRRPVVWRLTDGATLAKLPTKMEARCAAFTPDRSALLLGGSGGGGLVEVWDLAGRGLVGRLPADSAGLVVQSLAVDPRGGFFVSGGPDRTLTCWSLPELRLRWRLAPGGCCAGDFLELSPDGTLLVTGLNSGLIFVDTGSGAVVRKLRTNHERGIRGAAFSPDGRSLATIGYDSRLALWDVERALPRP